MKRAGLFAGLILISLASAPLVARWSTVTVFQPIPFNHRKHAENGLECSACHQLYETSARAGRPENATCLLCHETALTNTPEEQSLRRYTAQKEEVPWRRLTVLPAEAPAAQALAHLGNSAELRAANVTLQPGARPAAVGAQVARAVHGSLVPRSRGGVK